MDSYESLRRAGFTASVIALLATSAPATVPPQAEAPPLEDARIIDDFDHIVAPIWGEEEAEAWQRQRTDAERRAYIEEFWERRDPTLGTEANEFRDIYMGRVAAAAASFTDEGVPGYRTDRGRVLIVYGANALLAQEARRIAGDVGVGAGSEDVSGAAGRPVAARVMYLWTMDTSINPYLRDTPQLRFDPFQGTYPLVTRDLEFSQEAFLANRDVRELFAARRRAESTPFVSGDAAAASPEDAALRDLLERGVARDELVLDHAVSYFPAAAGNTYTVLAFEVGTGALTPGDDNVGVFGYVLRADPNDGEVPVHRIDDRLSIAAEQGSADESSTYTVAVTLAPGAHRAALGVIDVASGRAGTAEVPLDVPDLATGELGLSSVALARSPLRRTDEPIDVDVVHDALRIGPLVLDVDVDNVFARDDTISLLYFVLGAGIDPDSGAVRLQVTHRILVAADNQSIARLPEQTLTMIGVMQDIPLHAISQLQAGTDYKIQIHVRDLVGGAELYHAVPFRVAPAGS